MADKKQTMLYGLLTSIASKITYDNTESGLTAENVQDAIDEVNSNLSESTKTETVEIEWVTPSIFASDTQLSAYGKVVSGALNWSGGTTLTPTQDHQVIGRIVDPKYYPLNQTVLVPYAPSYTSKNWIYLKTNGELVARYNNVKLDNVSTTYITT